MKKTPIRIFLLTALFLSVLSQADAQFWKKKKKKNNSEIRSSVILGDSNVSNRERVIKTRIKKTIQTKISINYRDAFESIDSFIRLDQPKTAREKVLNVKNSARADRQAGYFIKALRYELLLIDRLEEDSERDMLKWQLLNNEFNPEDELIKSFISLEMASFLKQVYTGNIWNNNRIPDDSSKNPKDWSLARLTLETRQYINQSLMLSEDYPVETYLEPIMDYVKKYDLVMNVQQVIALYAIEILKGMDMGTAITYQSPDKQDAMSEKDSFIKKNFLTVEDPKNEYMILWLYQLVLSNYHIYFDLQRVLYVRNQYTNSGDDFVKACENIWEKHTADSFSILAAIELAVYYRDENPLKALSIIEKAGKLFPGFGQNARLRMIKSDIVRPQLDAQLEEINQVGKRILAKVNYNNIDKLYIRTYKIVYSEYLEYLANNNYYNDAKKKKAFDYLAKQKLIGNVYTVSMPAFGDYKMHSSEIPIEELPVGTHLLVICNSENLEDSLSVISFSTVCVSGYALLKDGHKLRLVDASNGNTQTGKPYRIFNIGNYWDDKHKYELVRCGYTDAKGNIQVPIGKEWNYNYVIEVENHVLYNESFYKGYQDSKEKDQLLVKVLTDRAIYRPGQKVYFKVIAYMAQTKKVVPGRKLTIVLKDNNHEEKGRMVLSSNRYGSVSGSFVLPKGGFNTGSFHIEVLNTYSNVYFRVEEYKRPKYTVKILEPDTAYKLNDEVKILGEAMALAGYAIQDAKVVYTVKRKLKPKFWGYWYHGPKGIKSSEQMINTGNLKTGSNGRFSVEFRAIPDPKSDPKENPYFIFEIAVTVTDMNGEVRTASYDMTMAYTDKEVSISGQQEYLDNEEPGLFFSLKNLQEQTLPFNGKITLKKIANKNVIKRFRQWTDVDTMAMNADDFKNWFTDYELPDLNQESIVVTTKDFKDDKTGKWVIQNKLDLGEYAAVISTVDGRGETINSEFRFRINPSKAGPYSKAEALKISVVNGKTFEPGQTAKLLISGGVENSVSRLLVQSKRGVIIEREIIISKNSQMIEIPVKPNDRGNIQIEVLLIYNYRNYYADTRIVVPYDNKQLQVKLSNFRNHLEPGSKEKWVMTLKGPASEKAAMEVAAVMYDQSLDELYKNSGWNFYPYYDFYMDRELQYSLGVRKFNSLKTIETNHSSYSEIIYPRFNETYYWGFGDGRGDGSRNGYYSLSAGGSRKNKGVDSDDDPSVAYESAVEDSEVAESDSKLKNESNNGLPLEKDSKTPEPLIRKNFNETAFFFPHLYANEKGEISLEFTMPEALTNWKMMILAHSTNMQIGYNEENITTSKKIMVQPNMPRFLRQGDKISIASKIINTTKEIITSKVSIKIIDEESGKTLTWLKDHNDKSISVPAGGSSACSFILEIPDYTGVVSIVIYASAGDFSDGEQNTLPVLSNRILVTETMPVTIRKAGKQQLEFTHLKNNSSTTLTHERFSVEMSSNPAWYTVMALPYLMEYPHECAEQVFTRLYANSIAMTIANRDPAIRKVYESWEKEAAKGTGLQSKLMQNQDLKSTLIEETPWLAEAKSEIERMRNLGKLFNRERMKDEMEMAFGKLKDMQMSNGAWGWFKGMYPNTYITQTIVIGFGKMKKMGVDILIYQDMIDKAISFLDAEAKRDYLYYRSLKDFQNLYPANLQYLYCKSYFPMSGLKDTSFVVQYFIENAEKKWQQNSLMNRAQLATALLILRPGSRVPQQIITSFNENSIQTDEMGMYWPKNTGGWYWHEATIETQAAIIEAYSLVGTNNNFIREQQVWLLRQKQSQSWKTTRSTADACYALLMNGNLLNNKQDITVLVNNIAIVPEKREAGTGYFRKDVYKEQISSGCADISVSTTTSDFAYGAVYWQYFEDMDKIQNAGAGLSISKRLYKVTHTTTGDQRIEIKDGEIIHIGDIIEVSLSISSDRNLEFVHIKDQRASGTEPADILSELHGQNGLGYYQSTRDASSNFFIDNMPKGNYRLNYTLKLEQSGVFNSGMATAQCMYATEYAANSKGVIINVE